MKNTRFTEEQKAFALRQAESGVPVEQIPAYCDRIIRRWEAMAGRKAELLDK